MKDSTFQNLKGESFIFQVLNLLLSPNAHVCSPISQQKPYGNAISPPRESYDRYIERPKKEVLEPVYDYLQDEEANNVQKPYDSYRIDPPQAPQENFSYKRPDYPQYGLEEPYEFRDEGHENQEESWANNLGCSHLDFLCG